MTDASRVQQALLTESTTLDSILHLRTLFAERSGRGRDIIFACNVADAEDLQHLAAEFVSRFNFDRPGLSAITLASSWSEGGISR